MSESKEQKTTNPSLPRLGFADNVAEAFKHVQKSVNSQGSKVRTTDYISIWLMPLTCMALMAASLCGGWGRLIVSILALASILYYVLARIGIMRTLNERQAALIWHILLATFLMGITFAYVFREIVDRF